MALGVGLAPMGCRLQPETTPTEIDQTAPDFTLPAHDGSTVTLTSLLDQGPTILVFYRGHW